jgi:DNA polymerase/3'-5' exonuclease PolX
MLFARRKGLRCEDGRLVRSGKSNEIIETPTEESFFSAVGVAYISPEQR